MDGRKRCDRSRQPRRGPSIRQHEEDLQSGRDAGAARDETQRLASGVLDVGRAAERASQEQLSTRREMRQLG
eukprot:scaffold7820_cov139-Isochrysis_galbana.AAC.1